jgi:ornithine cyclodeaminase
MGISVSAFRDPKRAVAGADIVVTTTAASQPVLSAAWLEPGQHVTAMGSDAAHKNELDPAAIELADLYVADTVEQTREIGELHHALIAGTVRDDLPCAEIGEIVAGAKSGRTNDRQTLPSPRLRSCELLLRISGSASTFDPSSGVDAGARAMQSQAH